MSSRTIGRCVVISIDELNELKMRELFIQDCNKYECCTCPYEDNENDNCLEKWKLCKLPKIIDNIIQKELG